MRRGILSSTRRVHRRRYTIIIATIWTAIIGASLIWNARRLVRGIEDLARAEARGAFNKDLAYRRWASSHGGVYVPVTEISSPNPYLNQVEERDITTPSGKALTLVNPAYMSRQVYELSEKQYGLRAHITSLNPLRPENTPDPWEVGALQRFEGGENEISEIVLIDGIEYMRFMSPLILEDSCLKCHGEQGYAIGDVRGGISVSVSMAPYRAIARNNMRPLWMGHLLLYALGLFGLSIGASRLEKRIREREEAEAALQRSQDSLAEAQRIAHLGSWDLDLEKNKLTWSDETYRIFGLRPQEFGATYEAFLDTIHPDDRAYVDKAYTDAVKNNTPYHIVYRIVRPDGDVRYVHEMCEDLKDDTGKVIRSFGTVQDITEQRLLEEQLSQSQKMEAIGRLAGGVAHDFNNLLTVISGNLDLILMDADVEDPVKEKLGTVHKASSSAAALTRQLLAFSKKQIIEHQVLNLNNILAQMEKMLRRMISEDIEFIMELGDNIGPVKADPGQIEQILMNLAVNARDAMPKGGSLSISTDLMDLDSEYIQLHPYVHSGPYVMLSVSDTGHGMNAETRAKIFEPFFSTKAEGSGIGLATVYGIVKQHNGSIQVYSEEGIGTTFKIYLPIVEAVDGTAAAVQDMSDRLPQGDETILLVEDEANVLELMSEILRGLGYTVFDFGHPQEALQYCQSTDIKLDLLVSDVIMPGMNGKELATLLLEMQPQVSTLFISGYTGDIIKQIDILADGVEFLSKPFTPQTLSQKVREVLDNRT